MTIQTFFWAKPIPDRSFDWRAVDSDYEPGCPVGYGATEADAIADLKEQQGGTWECDECGNENSEEHNYIKCAICGNAHPALQGP